MLFVRGVLPFALFILFFGHCDRVLGSKPESRNKSPSPRFVGHVRASLHVIENTPFLESLKNTGAFRHFKAIASYYSDDEPLTRDELRTIVFQQGFNPWEILLTNLGYIDEFKAENEWSLLKQSGSIEDYLSHSIIKSSFGDKQKILLKDLVQSKLNVSTAVQNYLFFHIETIKQLLQVHQELQKECFGNKDKLEYTVRRGESYTDEKYLYEVINKANLNRKEACQFYRSEMGNNYLSVFTFNMDRYMYLMRTLFGETNIPSDVVMVDAVAQNLSPTMDPACKLHFLCQAGLAKVQSKPHPGFDLLLGILVSGHAVFGEPLSGDNTLGTPQMAEAIYKGYINQCDQYIMNDTQCWRRSIENSLRFWGTFFRREVLYDHMEATVKDEL